MFLRQLMSIELSIIVNSRVFFVWVGRMRGRIGNPKQKLRGDEKKRELYTSGHYNENNKNYLLEKNNINNFRANQLPGATRKTMYGATDLTL